MATLGEFLNTVTSDKIDKARRAIESKGGFFKPDSLVFVLPTNVKMEDILTEAGLTASDVELN